MTADSPDSDASSGPPVSDGAPRDSASMHDAADTDDGPSMRDGPSPRDATSEQGVSSDGAGPPPADAAECLRACPTGFDCNLGKCEDRASLHVASESKPSGNWSYGSFALFGTSSFASYSFQWTAGGLDFWGATDDTIEPSVFHNSSLMSATYAGMKVLPAALGLYPAQNRASVVRWSAPQAGQYSINATFTGLGTAPVTMTAVYVQLGASIVFSPTINASMGANSATYTNPGQTMAVGDTVDFYVQFVSSGDDVQGGTGLEALFTAN